jgi:hypothetical protein
MHFLNRDGVTLAYKDTKAELPPIIFVHGCGCDHKSFAPQAEFFSNEHRVVLVDLRGHGESDTPQQDYSMSVFADDLAWPRFQSLTPQLVIARTLGSGHFCSVEIPDQINAMIPSSSEFISGRSAGGTALKS